jgi:DNA-binding transcriptional ArsR family regulator
MSDSGSAQHRDIAELDSRMLRALAHPLRVKLLDLLRADGPATASRLAERLAESSGLTSWHLRQLAEYGLVEEDEQLGNKRERWWRSKHAGHRMRIAQFLDSPDMAGSLHAYLQASADQRWSEQTRFIAELARWQDDWKGRFAFDEDQLSLTPEETAKMNEEIGAVLARYRRAPRAGDTTVVTQWAAFPRQAR